MPHGDGAVPPRRLSPVDVALLVPPRTLERGRDYVLLGRVRGLVRRGARIAGEVEGGEVYHVSADLSTERPRTTCTCPLRSQPCKHAAALLLVWAEDPGRFADLDALAAALRARPEALASALEEAFAGPAAPGLEPFLRAARAAGAAGGFSWDDAPLDAILEAPPELPEEEARSLWLRCAVRLRAEAERTRPRGPAEHLEAAWRWASLALWARRLPGLPSGPAREAVQQALAALEGHGPGTAGGGRARARRAFDRAAELAAALERPAFGDALRLLRAAWRLLPEEAAARWEAAAIRAAAAARRAELEGDADARARRAAAARAWAAGWSEAGRPERAAAVWELCADLEEADEGRVRAWMAAGDWARAADAARAGLERAAPPLVPWFRRQLALALMQLGRPEEAAPYLAANFEEAPTVRAYRDLRTALQATGAWAEAARAAAERLAAAHWPEPHDSGRRAPGTAPAAGGPAPAAAARAARWRAVAEALAPDAPLLALRYLAAGVAVLRAAGEEDEAQALVAFGGQLAAAGGEARRRAWWRLAGGADDRREDGADASHPSPER
ncbi:MAG: SWIM zinc finger family protein [Firmicutes bacterium]|nr:SWIM zinc finger family protein [Bacillota bacterium]